MPSVAVAAAVVVVIAAAADDDDEEEEEEDDKDKKFVVASVPIHSYLFKVKISSNDHQTLPRRRACNLPTEGYRSCPCDTSVSWQGEPKSCLTGHCRRSPLLLEGQSPKGAASSSSLDHSPQTSPDQAPKYLRTRLKKEKKK
ncbi:hypothetical protein ElyMa_006175300 [Elysia marginata]|uniref:Secreted protein n=1 Tax=Elysia marginata TaxID=1093978 RepID=A0AAV4H221_9GAST|nr:hypothetical protein ElyMa_006175300 [Elysia marginata]